MQQVMKAHTMNDDIVLIYATVPDAAVAEIIATALLDEKLIACANILPGMTSLYRWDGKVAHDSDVVMIMKTRATLADQAIEAARARHPYQTPAFVVLPAVGGHAPFLDWVRAATQSSA